MAGLTASRRVRVRVGVDVGATLNLVGALVKYFSPAFLFPVVLALVYSEPVWPFVLAGLIAAGTGFGLERVTKGKEHVGVREGFLVVSLTWALIAVVVALPYVLSSDEQLSRPIDAYFEAMSGMTTTGASVVTDIPALDSSMLMWRQFSQWVGAWGSSCLRWRCCPAFASAGGG